MVPWGSRVALVAQASSRCPCQRAGSPSPKHYFCPQASAGHRAGCLEAGGGQERSWAAPALRVFARGGLSTLHCRLQGWGSAGWLSVADSEHGVLSFAFQKSAKSGLAHLGTSGDSSCRRG